MVRSDCIWVSGCAAAVIAVCNAVCSALENWLVPVNSELAEEIVLIASLRKMAAARKGYCGDSLRNSLTGPAAYLYSYSANTISLRSLALCLQ